MDEDESDKINERLMALERYTDDSSKTTKMEVSKLLTGERLLQAKVIEVLQELRQSTTALTQGIESRTEFFAQELDWLSVFQAKALQLIHKERKLSNSLQQLLNGIRELNYGRLSQDIVPYKTLEDTMEHVSQKIKTHGGIPMYVIPKDVRQLHKQAIVHHVHVEDHLLISLLVPRQTGTSLCVTK